MSREDIPAPAERFTLIGDIIRARDNHADYAMTKTKRIVLLVVDIFTVLGGFIALFLFMAFSLHHSDLSPVTPSHEEISSASAATLRTSLERAVGSISFLSGTIEDASHVLLFCGVVMSLGSILYFWLTPWRVPGKDRKV